MEGQFSLSSSSCVVNVWINGVVFWWTFCEQNRPGRPGQQAVYLSRCTLAQNGCLQH